MADIKPSVLARTSPLSSDLKERLSEAQRFLVNITDPAIGVAAAAHGYDGEEHRQGWALWYEAAGANRPFEHALSEVQRLIASASSPAMTARFRVLDEFENKWFSRTRNAIRRFVLSPDREAVLEAFFADLSQEPLGPAVVSSVDLFLLRYAELEKSTVPGVGAAVAALAKKGLTAELRASVRATVESAKAEAPAAPPVMNAEAIAEATRAQLEAFARLNDWYIDWAETLRAELGYHSAVKLGIVAAKGGRAKKSEPEPAE